MLKAKSPCSLIYHQNNEKQNHKIFQAKRNPQDFVYQPPAQSRTNQIRSLVQQSTYFYLSSRALSIFRGGDFKISVSKLFQYFLIHMVKKRTKQKKTKTPNPNNFISFEPSLGKSTNPVLSAFVNMSGVTTPRLSRWLSSGTNSRISKSAAESTSKCCYSNREIIRKIITSNIFLCLFQFGFNNLLCT